jgi:hypothetical protein
MVTLDADRKILPSIDFTLDATFTERHTRKVIITKHPIEVGAKPSDHAELEPKQYVLEGVFSGTPLEEQDQQTRGLAGSYSFADGQLIASPDATALESSTFYKDIFDSLNALLEARETMTILTELQKYENMMMLTLDVPRDAATGIAVRFSATFEEMRFIQTQSTTLQQPASSVGASARTKPNGTDKQGRKVAQPVTDSTILKGATNAVNITTVGSGIVPGSPGH